MPVIVGSDMRRVVDYVIKQKEDVILPVKEDRHVHALVLQFNRWRQKLIDEEPMLGRVRFLKRFDPPRVIVEYWDIYDIEFTDSEGNPLGFTLGGLEDADRERMAEADRRAAEESSPGKEAEERYARKLARDLGIAPSDILDDGLTDTQRLALTEAEKQAGRELTPEEREHILNATKEDSIGDLEL